MSQHESPTPADAVAPLMLPATLRLGAVHLTISDLDRSVAFYEDAIGLTLHRRDDGVATMGVGKVDLLVLYEEPTAQRAGRHAGLYHYALLFPSREELTRAALRLAATNTRIQGASDHSTHEAIYLPDPDGNGIELAADRPRERWPRPLNYAGGPHPLDLEGLLATVEGEEPHPEAGPGLVGRPRAPARWRSGARARLLPRRTGLRARDAHARHGRVRVGRWLPPPRL